MKIKALAIVALAFALCLGFTQPMEAGFNLGGIKVDLPGGGGGGKMPGKVASGTRVYYAQCDLPDTGVCFDLGQNIRFKLFEQSGSNVLMISKPIDCSGKVEMEGDNLKVTVFNDSLSDSGIVYVLRADHFFTFKIPRLPGEKLTLVRQEGSIDHREIDYNNRYFN